MMQMQVMSFNQHPKIHNFTQRAISSPPMLETFIVLNEKDREKAKGKVEPMAPRGKKGAAERSRKTRPFFFVKAGKCLDCPQEALF